MPACLEDIVEADDVALEVHVGVLDAVSHARLRGEVHHDVKLVLGEELVHEVAVRDAAADETVLVLRVLRCLGLDEPQAILLQRRVVVGIEVVQADDGHRFAALQQPQHQIGAYESGTTGNEDYHMNKDS